MSSCLRSVRLILEMAMVLLNAGACWVGNDEFETAKPTAWPAHSFTMAHGIEGTVILHFLRKVEMPEQFFEIAIDGATLQTRWGKPGSKAVSAEKVFDDEEGACSAAAGREACRRL